MRFLFVVGFLLTLRGVSLGSLVFSPPQKPTSPNSNLTRIEDPHENQADVAFNIVIYLIIFLSRQVRISYLS